MIPPRVFSLSAVTLGVFALSGLVLAGCAQKPEPAKPPMIPVDVETVQSQSVEATTDFLARLDGRRTVLLAAQASGRVISVAVNSGDYVRAQTPLLKLSDESETARLASLTAEAQGARKQVIQAQETLQALMAQRASAEETLNVAKIELNRDEFLLPKEGASQQDVDVDRQHLASAQSQRDALDAQIKAQTAQVAAMQQKAVSAGYNQLEQTAQVSDFTVYAPFSGRVGDIPVKVGQWIEKGAPVTSLSQADVLDVAMAIPLDYVSQIHLNQWVRVNTLSGAPLGRARISFIDAAINPKTSSLTARAKFVEFEPKAATLGLLRPEQAIRATVIWRKESGMTIAPETRFNLIGQSFVFVARPDPQHAGGWIARQTPVKLGPLQHNRYVVTEGLKSGDRVIVSHLQKLRDGMPITLKSTQP